MCENQSVKPPLKTAEYIQSQKVPYTRLTADGIHGLLKTWEGGERMAFFFA